jgi:hypothetical protein
MKGVYVVIQGRRLPVDTLLERYRVVLAARRAGFSRLPVLADDADGARAQIDTMNVSDNSWWIEALADRLGRWMSRGR